MELQVAIIIAMSVKMKLSHQKIFPSIAEEVIVCTSLDQGALSRGTVACKAQSTGTPMKCAFSVGMCLSPSMADQALDLIFSKDFGALQVARVVACLCGLHAAFLTTHTPKDLTFPSTPEVPAQGK